MTRRGGKRPAGTPAAAVLAGGILGWRPGLACVTDGCTPAVLNPGRCVICGRSIGASP